MIKAFLPTTPAQHSLAVPSQFAEAITTAASSGRDVVAQFTRDHSDHEAWLFRATAIDATGYAPSAEVEKSELAELHRLQESRTESGIAAAKYYDSMWGDKLWQPYIVEMGAVQARLAARMLSSALLLTNDIAQTVKGASMRSRPYVADPTIIPAVGKPGNNPSFPSGHASAAFAAAELLSAFLPERATELRNLAAQVAFSRVYAGMHFPSDAVAGAKLGTMTGAFIASQLRAT